jgi:hypothetical protein
MRRFTLELVNIVPRARDPVGPRAMSSLVGSNGEGKAWFLYGMYRGTV